MQVSKRLTDNLLLTIPGGGNTSQSLNGDASVGIGVGIGGGVGVDTDIDVNGGLVLNWNEEDGGMSVSTMNTGAFRDQDPDELEFFPKNREIYTSGGDFEGVGVDYDSIRGEAVDMVDGIGEPVELGVGINPGRSTSSVVDDKSVVTMDDSQIHSQIQEYHENDTNNGHGDASLQAGGENGAGMSVAYSEDTDNNVVNINDNHGMHILKEQNSIATAMSFNSEYTALQDLFQEAHSRIGVWRVSAAREEELGEEIYCWLQCGYKDIVENISTHIKEDCPHRAVECPECRNILYSKDIKEHRKDICPKRLVGCPNAWQGCTEIVKFDFLEKHLTMKCELRLVP